MQDCHVMPYDEVVNLHCFELYTAAWIKSCDLNVIVSKSTGHCRVTLKSAGLISIQVVESPRSGVKQAAVKTFLIDLGKASFYIPIILVWLSGDYYSWIFHQHIPCLCIHCMVFWFGIWICNAVSNSDAICSALLLCKFVSRCHNLRPSLRQLTSYIHTVNTVSPVYACFLGTLCVN